MRLKQVVVCLCILSVASLCWAQEKEKNKKKKKKPASTSQTAFSMSATPPSRIKTLTNFKVELLYSVPKGEEGSWVNLCTDPRGRLIVSDQSGSLYRITVPPVGDDA